MNVITDDIETNTDAPLEKRSLGDNASVELTKSIAVINVHIMCINCYNPSSSQ